MKIYLPLAISALIVFILALVPSQSKAGDYYVSACRWAVQNADAPVPSGTGYAHYIDGWSISNGLQGPWQVLPNQCHETLDGNNSIPVNPGESLPSASDPYTRSHKESRQGINLMTAGASPDSHSQIISGQNATCTTHGSSTNYEARCSPRMFVAQNPNGTFSYHISPLNTAFSPQHTLQGQEGRITFSPVSVGFQGLGIRQAFLHQGVRVAGNHDTSDVNTPRPYAAGLFSNSTNLGTRFMFYGFPVPANAQFSLSQNSNYRGSCIGRTLPINIITGNNNEQEGLGITNACYFGTMNGQWDIGLDAGHSSAALNVGTLNQNSAELTSEIGLRVQCGDNPCNNVFAGRVAKTGQMVTGVTFGQYYAARLNMYGSRIRIVDSTAPQIGNIGGALGPNSSATNPLTPLGPGAHTLNDFAVTDVQSSGVKNGTVVMLNKTGGSMRSSGAGITSVTPRGVGGQSVGQQDTASCAIGDLRGESTSADGLLVSSRLRPCPAALNVPGFSQNMTGQEPSTVNGVRNPYRLSVTGHDASNNPVSASWNIYYDPTPPPLCPSRQERIESDIPSPQNRQPFPGQGTVTWARRQITEGFCVSDNDRIAETHAQYRTRVPGGGWSGWQNVPGCTQPPQTLGTVEHTTTCRLDTSTFEEGTQVEFRKYARDGAGNLLPNTSFNIDSFVYVDNTSPRVTLKNGDFFKGSVPTTEYRIGAAPDNRKWTNGSRTSFEASVQNGNYSTPITEIRHTYWSGPNCSASDQEGNGINNADEGKLETLSTPIPAAGNRDREFSLNNKACTQDQGEHKVRVWAVDALGNSSGPVSGARSNGGSEIRAWISAPSGAGNGSGGTTDRTDRPYFYDDVDPNEPTEYSPAVYPETSVPGGWVVQWRNPNNFGPEGTTGDPRVSQMKGLRINWANQGEKQIRSGAEDSTGTNYHVTDRPKEGVRVIGVNSTGETGLYCTQRGAACTEGKLYVDKGSVPTSGVVSYVIRAEDWAGNISKPYTINAMYDNGKGCVLN